MESYKTLKGKDNLGGVVYLNIVNDLADLAGNVGLETISNELRETDFIIDHIPKEDGGPDWENDIFKEVVDSATGNCLDVSWL